MGWLVLGYLVFAGLLCGLAALWWAGSRWRRHRRFESPETDLLERVAEVVRQRAEHHRNVSALRHQCGIPIERLAADLRRLRRIIAVDASSSAAHQLGNRLAYDRLLIQTCAMLGIEHELATDTAGHARDIERLRVEAELERAGLILSTGYGRAA
ncbi:hypothetical protein [Microlunatus sp. GCM10028923]|uniref:hypothetical protein n=1 Tax=Microlunatus sp. GCM10028923 TaxID=3273400 RepID=UPI0036211310